MHKCINISSLTSLSSLDRLNTNLIIFLDLQNSIPFSLFWNFTGHCAQQKMANPLTRPKNSYNVTIANFWKTTLKTRKIFSTDKYVNIQNNIHILMCFYNSCLQNIFSSLSTSSSNGSVILEDRKFPAGSQNKNEEA